jgi:hypothetical protein
MSPQATQYCRTIFYFAFGSGRENILSDSNTACVAAQCLEKEKKSRWIKEGHKWRPHHKHEILVADFILSEPNDYFFCVSTIHYLMGYLSLPHLQSLKNTNLRGVTRKQRLSIKPYYLTTANAFEDMKFISFHFNQLEVLFWRSIYCSADR